MKIINTRNLNESSNPYLDMLIASQALRKGLGKLGVGDGYGSNGKPKDAVNDQRRVEKRAKISGVFAKDMIELNAKSPNNITMDKVICIYSRFKKDSIFRFSIRNKIDEKYIEFKVNDINPDAGFEPDFYDITVLKNDGFDPKLNVDYKVFHLLTIKDTKNNF